MRLVILLPTKNPTSPCSESQVWIVAPHLSTTVFDNSTHVYSDGMKEQIVFYQSGVGSQADFNGEVSIVDVALRESDANC